MSRAFGLAILSGLAACTPVARAPASGPYVAHVLEGPFPSLDAYCTMASRRDGWGPDRHCRSNGPEASTPHVSARVFFIDDRLTGVSPISSCGLAITTSEGVFVDVSKDRCEGLEGPTHGIHTDVAELAWTGNELRMRVVETVRWWHAKDGETSSTQTVERLVVCSLSERSVPRCTPPIDIGCSDTAAGKHTLTWKLESGVLHLRGSFTPPDVCDVGTPLVPGDFVVW